jgi:serine phosphatase RsbU (regulator of sigma subunit)
MMPLAALSMVWGATMTHYYATDLLLINSATLAHMFPGAQQVVIAWHIAASHAFTAVSACILVVLMGLLSRDQQRTARERAALAGEMQSAREIQQYLIPDQLPPTPGLAIHSVYQPSREVGGDFFQVLPCPRDGSTLIVIGDVAGKGLQAGMLAALIVGAIRTAFQFTEDPAGILAVLNERLQGRGLVTCLAMRIDPNGSAQVANAGHLPPYINGKELALEGAFPLGALPAVSFPSQRFQLSAGDSLLLISDGIIEARNTAGELFGFERTREISTQSAEAIAKAAQNFGQEDDITVLTLTRLASS